MGDERNIDREQASTDPGSPKASIARRLAISRASVHRILAVAAPAA